MPGLRGRTAVVTGGATGIGLATTRALAESGAQVWIASHDEAKTGAAIKRLSGLGLQLRPLALEVRDTRSVERAFAVVANAAGGLDILVNNAGIDCRGGVDELSEAEWDDCLDTNLKGSFLCSRAAIPLMRLRGTGVIVNNASNAALLPRAEDPAYCASKAGLVAMTKSMALGLARDRIRVNAVCPGPVAGTEIMDRNLSTAPDRDAALASYLAAAPLAAALGRLIDPAEVGELIVYLCSDAAAMVTGAVVAIDGGKSAGRFSP